MPPRPATPAGTGCPSLEWNALINRARASLAAQRACLAEGLAGTACRDCPLGVSAFPATSGPGQCPCRPSFRATMRRLRRLARNAPPSGRFQMRRTLDCFELDYRQLWKEGGSHD